MKLNLHQKVIFQYARDEPYKPIYQFTFVPYLGRHRHQNEVIIVCFLNEIDFKKVTDRGKGGVVTTLWLDYWKG